MCFFLPQEFFLAVKHLLRSSPGQRKWGEPEERLDEELRRCGGAVHAALCDNVDTRTALDALRDLVAAGNAYIDARGGSATEVDGALLKGVAAYITRIFDVLGLIPGQEIGFPASSKQNANVSSTFFFNFTLP